MANIDFKIEKDSSTKPEYAPPLRADLKLQRAPDESDGSQMYTIYDPVAGKFYKISWVEAAIIQEMEPSITIDELVQKVNKKSTANVTKEDVKEFFSEAAQLDLITRIRTGKDIAKDVNYNKSHPLYWLLIHYLYFRVPLFNPDEFLERTLHYVKPLVSRKAMWLYAIVFITGMIQLINHREVYIHTFSFFYNIQGIFVYGLAITVIKIIHELSHAYTARYYHVHVPTIGLAFIVLWPVLYTDVTDGWKLTNRFHRLTISAAGITAELILAGFATWGWLLTPPGILQSVFFLISSTTIISSLVLNLNPLMRFDGYYILSDLWGIDNLQNQAFALTRWQLRKWFLGLDIPPPEEVSKERLFGMMIYSLFTWVYRVSLYIFVALFVYLHFTKLLGIILFCVEIGMFLILPVVDEVKEIVKMRQFLSVNPRSICTALALSLFAIWFIFPMPHTHYFESITIPYKNQTVYAPQPATVKEIYVKQGDTVVAGQTLFLLYSKELDSEISKYQAELDAYRRLIRTDGLTTEYKGEVPENRVKLSATKSHLEELYDLKKNLLIRSDFSGTVYFLKDPLSIGETLKQNEVIAKIANFKDIKVISFVPEDQIEYIKIGDAVKMRFDTNIKTVPGKVIKIRSYKEEDLVFKQLSSLHGGNLPVTTPTDPKDPEMLIESYYTILVQLEVNNHNQLNIGQEGYVLFEGPWQSKLVHFLKTFYAQFWKQSAL